MDVVLAVRPELRVLGQEVLSPMRQDAQIIQQVQRHPSRIVACRNRS
jgi:hypothetical protein